MEDYPRTLEEFEGRFVTEQACREYLMRLRWPGGFACPRCGGQRARPSRRRGLLRCGQCDYQASVTAGTIFQDTRLPLRTWYRAMWWVTSQKTGASALGLQSILGLGSYGTAWALLHKLRRAMVRPGRERLTGRVEVDETFVGGEEKGVRGRQTLKKALVVIAAEEDGAGIGRIRMKRIRRASKQQLCTASSKRLSNPTAPSTLTAGKVTSAWRRLAIGTSTTWWPLRANQPRNCCLAFTAWLPC